MMHLRTTTIAILLICMPAFLYGQAREEAVEAEQEVAVEVNEVVEEMAPDANLGFEQADAQIVILWQYVCTECGLARRACDLSNDQLGEIQKIDKKWLKSQLENPPQAGQLKLLQGIGRFLGGRINAPQRQDELDGVKRVRKEIDEQLAVILNEEQHKVFLSEREARAAFRGEAMAGVLVAAYDQQIYVQEEQRAQLINALSKWVSGKNLYWQFYFQNKSYVPNIPTSILRKCLNTKQTKAIQSLNAYNYEMDDIQFQMAGFQEQIFFVEVVEEEPGEDASDNE